MRQPALARVCEFAKEHGIRLAGAERQVAAQGFKRYVDNKLLQVVMPDIKYAGGYTEIVKICQLTAAGGIEYSPRKTSATTKSSSAPRRRWSTAVTRFRRQ